VPHRHTIAGATIVELFGKAVHYPVYLEKVIVRKMQLGKKTVTSDSILRGSFNLST
jgi:hypothetical protein